MKRNMSMKAYIIRRIVLVVGVLCIAAGTLWSQGGISDVDLAKATQDPALSLTFPVRPLSIETQSGKTIDLQVEVAATPEHWQQGLMFRTELADDKGMIFLMGEPPRVVSFWMKNTLIPLDMVFIDKDWRIANIRDNATPKDETGVSSEVEVIAVLELAGGRAQALGLEMGDQVVFKGL